ncbi:hypothetical protein RHSIM_RhsimUnG0178700 [Rhododendron simsii]|uniref:Uncharacterized protein n=1 Tax=Rhododendron simsii TaxID=118357 RepID=A0A834FUN7_RHOSS|nr:hypothetical protein RHSIM_RhsimUnG0178700 [Rhododendron simsii]
MSNDMAIWQAERSFEKRKFEPRLRVLLLQTLHFSDREKVEAALPEVLVGKSFIYQHCVFSDKKKVEALAVEVLVELSFIYWLLSRQDCGDIVSGDGGGEREGGRCSFDGGEI